MYKPTDKTQTSFLDFNQLMGLHMNPDNRWIQMAHKIPCDKFEVKYADLFPNDTGNVAKPLRMALGALIIQSRFQFPDRELVEQITENHFSSILSDCRDTRIPRRLMQAHWCCSANGPQQICCARQKNTFLPIKMAASPNHRVPEMIQMKTAGRKGKKPTKELLLLCFGQHSLSTGYLPAE